MQVRFAATEIVQLDVPLLSPTIRDYLRQTDQIVGAIADPQLTEKVNAELYRLKMQPIGFLELYQFQPIVTLKIWCDRHNIVHLQSVDYQLNGLEAFMDGFELTLDGSLTPLDQDGQIHLEGRADLTVTLDVPPPLRLTPKPLLEMTGDRLLSEVLQRIKHQILKQLVADYQQWTTTH
jgi:hypothetical protein